MSDRPDLDEAISILQAGGIKVVGGKYAPPEVQAEWVRKLKDEQEIPTNPISTTEHER